MIFGITRLVLLVLDLCPNKRPYGAKIGVSVFLTQVYCSSAFGDCLKMNFNTFHKKGIGLLCSRRGKKGGILTFFILI